MKLSHNVKKLFFDKNIQLCVLGGILFVLLANDQVLHLMDGVLHPILKPIDEMLFDNKKGTMTRNLLIFVHGIVFILLLLVINATLMKNLFSRKH